MKKYLLLILIFIGIISFLASKSFGQNQKQLKNKKNKPPVITPTLVPPKRPIKYGWKEFNNSQLSFLYPENASIETIPSTQQNNSLKIQSRENNAENVEGEYIIEMYSLSASHISFDEYVQQAHEGAGIECKSNSFISNISDITATNLIIKTFYINNCLSRDTSSIQYFILNQNSITQITATINANKEKMEIYRDLIDQVIKSISFK